MYVIVSNHTVHDILLRSYLTTLLSTTLSSVRVTLLYTCTKDTSVSALTPKEEEINQQNSNNRIQFTTGRINQDMLQSLLQPIVKKNQLLQRVVISGPRGMYETVHNYLINITTHNNTPIIQNMYDIVELEA